MTLGRPLAPATPGPSRPGRSAAGRRRWVAAALALAVLATAAPGAAKKRATGDLGAKQRDLQKTQKRLSEERRKAADAKKREAGLLSELEAIDRRLTVARKQLRTLDGRIKTAESDIAELRGDIDRLSRRRVGQEDVLERRLRTLYKLEAGGGVVPWLLSQEDPVARAVQLRHLASLATVDARLIREYRVTSEGLAERKTRLEARQMDLKALRVEVDQERADTDREAARRQALLARVKDERAYHERMVGELSEATRRLEAFIRDLQEKQRRAAALRAAKPRPPRSSAPAAVPGGTGFAALRGRLAWPAAGRVVGEFGAQVHPRFGTKTFRNGIEIDVAEGTAIAAVAGGQVLYTGWFRGYGNLIIVDHGGEYFTLYAHVSDIRVTEGDEVKQGQIIGSVGDTGSLSGPRLYFEVRHSGKPQDPSQWLRPQG
jgi:septal ring factor EnvC (AmiA/AmiB activator)